MSARQTPDADRGIDASAGKSSRWRSIRDNADNCDHRLLDRELRRRWASIPATRLPWRPQQTLSDGQGISGACATTPSTSCAKSVSTGGSNVQFAVNPASGRRVVIEMNPRVSRSLGPGVEGDRLPDRQDRRQARRRLHARRAAERHHARGTPAAFEPTIDYVVVRRSRALRSRSSRATSNDQADDADEVGRRGDGDRAHVQGELPTKRFASLEIGYMTGLDAAGAIADEDPGDEVLRRRHRRAAARPPVPRSPRRCAAAWTAGRDLPTASRHRPLVPAQICARLVETREARARGGT